MRELMLGNKAVARGMYEAGCKVISSYPGTPSTEITEEAAKYDEIYCEWAPNEKVALEAAHGATLGGVRAACAMKHVGLNVAADPLFTISYQGLNAGLVICVADDPGMHSSQNEQDSRHYAFAAKVPMLEPADSEESRLFVKEAYEISEKYNTPVFIKMCTRVAHSQSVVCPEERVEPTQVPYVKDPTKVMMTKNSRDAHVRVEQRTLDLIQYAETSGINRVEECAEGSLVNGKKIGVITSSTSYQYTKEVFGDKVSVLKLGMVYPLPEKLIKDFAQGKDEIYVIEELDPIIENHCKQLGIQVHGKDTFPICGEFSQNLIKKCMGMEEPEYTTIDAQIPGRPPVMCAGCPHRGIFYILHKKKIMVYGDIGCYTLGNALPLDMVDTCLCMGAGLNIAQGIEKVEPDTTCFAFVGDSTFFASAITGVVNAVYNQANMILIVLDNSTTAMTGHQPHPGTGRTVMGEIVQKINIEQVLRGIGVTDVKTVNPLDLNSSVACVREMADKTGVKAIIFKSPCIAITKPEFSLHIDAEKCIGCKKCIRELGCPAIVLDNGNVCIDDTMCTGCGLCSQVCPTAAIIGGKKHE